MCPGVCACVCCTTILLLQAPALFVHAGHAWRVEGAILSGSMTLKFAAHMLLQAAAGHPEPVRGGAGHAPVDGHPATEHVAAGSSGAAGGGHSGSPGKHLAVCLSQRLLWLSRQAIELLNLLQRCSRKHVEDVAACSLAGR